MTKTIPRDDGRETKTVDGSFGETEILRSIATKSVSLSFKNKFEAAEYTANDSDKKEIFFFQNLVYKWVRRVIRPSPLGSDVNPKTISKFIDPRLSQRENRAGTRYGRTGRLAGALLL